MAVPSITIFVRHSADCSDRLEGEFHKRCNCRKHLRWFHSGKLYRQSAKTRSWAQAEAERRKLEARFEAANGAPVKPEQQTWKTVAQAIELFLNNKRGEHLAPDSVYRHKFITGLFLNFCNRMGIVFIKDITLSHLTTWRSEWTLKSAQARRSRQEKIKNFFKFCFGAGMMATNPALQLSAIKVKNNAEAVRPFDSKEYETIMAAVSKTTMTPANKARTKACMQLQRYSGLSLVDAVCLAKNELIQENGIFRVRCDRQKTGTHTNNIIPTWLGKELLAVKNGNAEYFFWSGATSPEDAPSYFHKMYRRVFKAAGIDGASHDFRHTYAVELLKAGVDIRKVSKALGHSSIQTTERYYGKWNKAQQDIMDEEIVKALTGAVNL